MTRISNGQENLLRNELSDMTSPELAACLEGYQGAGVLDSSGGFSLSDERAQAKFRQFQLPEPRLYVLNLQAAAVCGGASWIDFEGDADDLYFRCDADLGPSASLQDLNSAALTEAVPQGIRELAFALNGCLALSPKDLSLRYWDGKAGVKIGWDTDRFVYAALKEPPSTTDAGRPATLSFHLRERAGRRTVTKFLSRVSGAIAADSEEDAVARHCNRSPIPLRFNGSEVVRPIDLHGADKALLFLDGALPKDHPLSAATHLKTVSAPGPYRGLLVKGGRLAPWIALVVNGVSFKLAHESLASTGLRGVVYSESLQKDLSQVQLAQNKEYQQLVEAIKSLAEQLP